MVYGGICWYMVVCAGMCGYVVVYGITWLHVVICGGMWWYVVVYDGIWWYMVVCGGMCWYVVVYGGMWWYVVVWVDIWWYIVVYGGMLWYVVVYDKMMVYCGMRAEEHSGLSPNPDLIVNATRWAAAHLKHGRSIGGRRGRKMCVDRGKANGREDEGP